MVHCAQEHCRESRVSGLAKPSRESGDTSGEHIPQRRPKRSNRPPALAISAHGKNPYRRKKASMGFFVFGKAYTGSAVWVFTLSRYRAGGLSCGAS